MPAQTPIERDSLTTSLIDRYENQKVGGAFDVKSAILSEGHMSLTLAGNTSFVSARVTPSGFKVKQPLMMTEFKNSSLNTANLIGVSTRKYKP